MKNPLKTLLLQNSDAFALTHILQKVIVKQNLKNYEYRR
ncbi:hypothetical protein Rain11_1071 [Raineya orbicola]|jgi:hypothetical protein|uniref:Uncharacterized protein n=1 Tax=Raineya orbicola TaxID=2016530 RepID=A0A2N3IHU8_9BACT|nr:hypothetical protein Rain11_1071 [Raineya orbicola]